MKNNLNAAAQQGEGQREGMGRLLRLNRERISPRERRRRRFFLAGTLLAVAILAALAIFLPRRDDSQSFENYMRQAAASYQQEDYDSALRSLRKASAIDASEACLMLMADCYESQGNLEKALETLRQMDTGNSSVAQRIASLEQRRMQQTGEEQLLVAGQSFAQDTEALSLEGMGLTDAALPEIVQLYALHSLSLKDNAIRDVSALAVLGGLDSLDLRGNQIHDLSPLANLRGLRSLYLDGNPVTDFSPLYGLEQLTSLSIRGIEISREELQALSEALPGCAIERDGTKADVYDITLGGVSFKSDVTELDLSGLGIREIGALADCKQLRILNLSGNKISDLQPLMNLPELEVLNVSGNELSNLRALMGMSTLYSVDASNNEISDTLALGQLTAMSSLNLSNNPISDFAGLKTLTRLQTLRLESTGIQDEDLPQLEGLTMLRLLILDKNPDLSDVAVGHLQSMLPGCVISHSELAYRIQLGANELRSDVVELDLSGQGMESLDGFERFTRLEVVDLSGNNLRSLHAIQYCNSRDSLRELNLAGNQIDDLSALAGLTGLESLDLSHNRVSDVTPLLKLSNLRTLRIGGNLLSAEQVAELRQALPDCAVLTDD